jgi:hypothetical protein
MEKTMTVSDVTDARYELELSFVSRPGSATLAALANYMQLTEAQIKRDIGRMKRQLGYPIVRGGRALRQSPIHAFEDEPEIEAEPRVPKAGTKLAKLLRLLRRPMDLDELSVNLRCSSHAARVSVSRARARGYVIFDGRDRDGHKTYHLSTLCARGWVPKK